MDVTSVAGSGGVLSFPSEHSHITPGPHPNSPPPLSPSSDSQRTPSPVSLQPFYITARNPDGSTYQAQVLAESEETARQIASHFHREIVGVSAVAPRAGGRATQPAPAAGSAESPPAASGKKSGLIKRLFGL